MKFLLPFLVLFLNIACHEINSTSNSITARNLPFNNSVYLSIPHVEESSILRRKLLNSELDNQLDIFNENTDNTEIDTSVKFQFVDKNLKFSSLDNEEYNYNKVNAAEVIVSYKDHLDFYFVPNGIDRFKALAQLGLKPKVGSSFFWSKNADTYLVKNKTYYLVEASKEEIKNNDIYFNYLTQKIGSEFNEKIFTFSKNQKISLKIKGDVFEKEKIVRQFNRSGLGSRNCDQEAGTCGRCTYKMEMPSGEFVKKSSSMKELSDLVVKINGEEHLLEEFNPIQNSEGEFLITLDLKKYTQEKEEEVIIEFQQKTHIPVIKQVTGVDYTPSCFEFKDKRSFDFTPKINIDLTAEVFGRNLGSL